MPWMFLLAGAAGFIVGRVLDGYRGGDTEAEAFEESDADKTIRAEVAERGGAEATAATPATPGESRTGKIDAQEGILNVLSGNNSVAMPLAEVAQRMGMPNHAPLIRPMRSLCDGGLVVKVNKAYRLGTMPH